MMVHATIETCAQFNWRMENSLLKQFRLVLQARRRMLATDVRELQERVEGERIALSETEVSTIAEQPWGL